MKPRSLLILTLLVGGLAAFWWFYERELPGSDERAKLAKKVLAIEEKDVSALRIEWDGKTVDLAKDPPAVATATSAPDAPALAGSAAPEPPAKWRLTAPLQAVADAGAVNGLVASLVNLDKDRTLEDVDRQALGLANPRAKVAVTTTKGERVLEIGGEIPASGNMVVAFAGESTAYVVGKYLFGQLTKAPGDWRSKEIFPGSRDDIERIRLTATGEEPLLIAKRGDEHWLEAPLADRADRDVVSALLGTLGGLRAESFVDEPADLAALGLAPAAGTMDVILAGEEQPFQLEVGTPLLDLADPAASKRYARATSAAGTVLFATTADLTSALVRPVAEWQAKAWASLEVYQVDSLEVTDAAGTLTVDRDGADWRRGGKQGDKIAYTAVSDFLYAVSGVRASALRPGPAAALGPALLTLKLAGGEDRSETLTVHAAEAELVALRSEDREMTLLVPAATVTDLQDKLQLLRTAAPLPGEPGDDEGGDDDGGVEAAPAAGSQQPAVELGAGQ